MTFNSPRDPRDPNAPVPRGRPAQSFGGWLPLVFAAAVAVGIMALVYPRVTQTGDATNTGQSVQTVAPAPEPSTSPVVPMPNPTTEQPNTPAPNP